MWDRIKKLFGSAPSNDNPVPAKAAPAAQRQSGLQGTGLAQQAMAAAQAMAKPCVGLVPDESASPISDVASFIGGRPYWPANEPYPQDAEGKPFFFLAQINYADLPRIDPFPESGLLQVFVATDDLMGCAMPSKDQQGFRTIYRSDHPDCPQYAGEIPDTNTYGPFEKDLLYTTRVALKPEIGTMLPSCYDFAFRPQLDLIMPEEWDDDVRDDIVESLDASRISAHYFGGHIRFTQYDIRSPQKYSDYTHVLLQLGWDKYIMWGDAGEASFLIREDDLRKRDFSKTIYNWDCY